MKNASRKATNSAAGFILALFLVCTVLYVPAGVCASEGPGLVVDISDGLLSVKADEANLGQIMQEIGRKTGIEIDLNPSVASLTVSTDFSSMELEKGIQRILRLLNHKNFFIYYTADGSVSKVEIHEEGSTGKPSGIQRPQRRSGRPSVRRPSRPGMTRNRQPSQTVRPPQRPVVPQPPIPEMPMEGMPNQMYDPMMVNPEGMPPMPPMPGEEGMPHYIPPSRGPAYIPPRPAEDNGQ